MNIYESRDEIKAHALAAPVLWCDHCKIQHPVEVCGLIIRRGQKQEVARCENASKNPQHNFLISPRDYRQAEDRGEILAAYHSHFGTPAVASDGDKTVSEAHNLPFIIYSSTADAWGAYTPCGWKAQLEGRPFIHGILDCYTLVRDYYMEVCGIELDDFYREDDWWLPVSYNGRVQPPQNLYMENVEKQGFKRVNTLRVHDALLMMLDSPVVNHVAVLCEPGMIIHHPPGHLSGRHPYIAERGYYAENTVGIWRHKSLA